MARRQTRTERKPAPRGARPPKRDGEAALAPSLLGALKDYHERSRELALSFLLVIPLLVLYEVGIALLRSPVGSGAGVEVRRALEMAFGTRWAPLVFNAVVLLGFVGVFIYLRLSGGVRVDLLPLLLVESTVYAVALGYGVSQLTSQLPLGGYAGSASDGLALNVVLSVGAGVYEEIVFRLALMSVLYAVAMLILPQAGMIVVPIIVLVSALIFSACHYFGIGSDPFSSYTFLFRFFCGVVFSTIYVFRGLGTAVYTHAIYDIFVALRYGL